MKKLLFIMLLLFFLIIFISYITTFVVYSNSNFSTSLTKYYSSSNEYSWPIPDYHNILELIFLHLNGTDIYSSIAGKVTYLGFYGANGYTLTIENSNIAISYSHISPEIIVKIGDYINKGQLIAKVGPKYILEINNNPYKDSLR